MSIAITEAFPTGSDCIRGLSFREYTAIAILAQLARDGTVPGDEEKVAARALAIADALCRVLDSEPVKTVTQTQQHAADASDYLDLDAIDAIDQQL